MPIYIVSLFKCLCGFLLTFYIIQTATALGKLGHPDGELNLTRAAARHGVIQMVRHYVPYFVFKLTYRWLRYLPCHRVLSTN